MNKPEPHKKTDHHSAADGSMGGNDQFRSILLQYWGYREFRPLQQEVIHSVAAGRDTLALMPTGGGKSLCYQVPAMAAPGLCLVISPLIALMKDQVEALRRKGITAFAIYSGMKRAELIHTLKTAGESNCKFLYVSPERLETNLFKEYLPSLNVNLVAVDEAHCISQWGYDFRPPYLRIALLRDALPGVPILALTASATPAVQQDIIDKLCFENGRVFRQSFARPNLSYSVFRVNAKIIKLAEILQKVNGSAIVYCRSRRRTRDIAAQLQSYGISADHYHAGLDAAERSRRQEAWINNEVRTIVCTNAFGMGIDKPDVRVVIHADLPDCLENYYQEAGRAGRDQKKAYAVLLHQPGELEEMDLQPALRYPPLSTIRRVYQAIVNFLQLPEGSAEGRSFDFDVNACAQRFNLPITEILNVLKVLEQDGIMGFSEQVFIPVRVQFICSKETLYQYENEHPADEELIKLLLRTYEGIYDMPVAIYEKQVAGWLKKEVVELQLMLQRLHATRIIAYEPQKDKPQLYLLQARVKASDLRVREPDYSKRKKAFENRLQQFTAYVQNTKDCRSVITGNYFGDQELKPCGICDNCLEKKKSGINAAEFNQVQQLIDQLLQQGAVSTTQLLGHCKAVSPEKVWEVLDFMQSENLITTNKQGQVQRC